MAPHRVFVYGTLKQGFRNYHVNRGTRLPGDFVTVLAFPLLVIGEFGLPWLVHEPGRGQPIRGQVFEVDDAGLAALDVLERVAEPGWYTRRPLAVAPVDAGTSVDAMAYFGTPVAWRTRPCTPARSASTRWSTRPATAGTCRSAHGLGRSVQLTSARSQSGIAIDFWALKSVHTVVLPPSA